MPAEQVHSLALETLMEHFPLGVEGYRYQDADIFNIVIAAAATLVSSQEGAITFDLWVACRYAAGQRDKHGIEYLPFAVVGKAPCELPVNRVADAYRLRFGIETSYRQMNRVKARTSSRYPDLRLLLVGVGFLLTNLWVWLKTQLVAATSCQDRPAARTWLDRAFRLDRFRDLLIEVLKARHGVHDSLAYPFALSTPLAL